MKTVPLSTLRGERVRVRLGCIFTAKSVGSSFLTLKTLPFVLYQYFKAPFLHYSNNPMI
jgi:hypothetical protein